MDGLSQENLLIGAKNITSPLTAIINQSIKEGQFPTEWREALVTPVLKRRTLSSWPITDLSVAVVNL